MPPTAACWAAEVSTAPSTAPPDRNFSPNAAHSAAARRARPRSPRATAFRLPARHVIHTVGPIWEGGGADEERLLANAYANSLALAKAHGLRSIAFPAISTGVYAFPPDRAANIAVTTVVETIRGDAHFTAVVFCCFTSASAEHHEQARRLLKLQPPSRG
jgi:hypothetical protein